ncbi:SRPBCC family protein [Nocardioides sp. TF02-7]|uniref:SRPBCC family protein n=1 Tax=Nocardioides sp. TF02-7 TaxID=2917724 RepID=UPI001F0531B8|nr:SRPBCC family protein [Nocardioides sp. TF02-7]UMG94134.1 SRPBCC family protein [Nocardioides sp. TF02-7]
MDHEHLNRPTVSNVHERLLPSALAECAPLLDGLATDVDVLWPTRYWPAMRFRPGLQVGAAGGHGPIRYTVELLEPGRLVRFRFTGPDGFEGGYHEFRLEPVGSDCTRLIHVLEMSPRRWARVSWPLMYRPLHDALIEDALDQAQAATARTAVTPPRWSMYVRLLRLLARLAATSSPAIVGARAGR